MLNFCNHHSCRCDADPAALAKYVFALVKKDKPVTELRSSMVEQLDVFLQSGMFIFVCLHIFQILNAFDNCEL
jgi:RNA-binding protein 26